MKLTFPAGLKGINGPLEIPSHNKNRRTSTSAQKKPDENKTLRIP